MTNKEKTQRRKIQKRTLTINDISLKQLLVILPTLESKEDRDYLSSFIPTIMKAERDYLQNEIDRGRFTARHIRFHHDSVLAMLSGTNDIIDRYLSEKADLPSKEFLVKKLSEILTKDRENYVRAYKVAAGDKYRVYKWLANKSIEEKCKYIGIPYTCQETMWQIFDSIPNASSLSFRHNSRSTIKERRIWRAKNEKYFQIEKATNLVNHASEFDYVTKEGEKAYKEFSAKIEKLAGRLISRNVDVNSLELIARGGVKSGDIQTTLKDKNRTYNVFTIYASGEVQRPHLRYLVK